MAAGQKSRKPKTSKNMGVKHKKHKMDPIALVIMGKGVYRNINVSKNSSERV